MKIITYENKVGCQNCQNMANDFVVKNQKLICLNCYNQKKLLKLQEKEKLKPRQRKLFKYDKWDIGKLGYAIDGVTSVVNGGFFK